MTFWLSEESKAFRDAAAVFEVFHPVVADGLRNDPRGGPSDEPFLVVRDRYLEASISFIIRRLRWIGEGG